MDNRFYKIDNTKDKRQYQYIYINLDDISSVEYPNETLLVGKLTTKTGKEYFIQKEELDKIIKLLNIISDPVYQTITFDVEKMSHTDFSKLKTYFEDHG